MTVAKEKFGVTKDGKAVTLYTLTNKNGMKAQVTDFGAILVNLYVPCADGSLLDVVLGFDNVSQYEVNGSYFGSTVGPSANRIGGARFTLDGVTYQLPVNDGANNLHSDADLGYHKLLWDAEVSGEEIIFTICDEDGYLGFPGNKTLSVAYALTDDNALTIHYHGTSDKRTIFNPTNHTYFNLNGHGNGNILEHAMQLHAASYTPVVAGAIPTGEIAYVEGTPMDFTKERIIGVDIDADFEQLNLTGGYDHNWVIDDWNGELKEFAVVKADKTGLTLYAYTTLPGVQFYAGNFITSQTGKGGVTYEKRDGFCLETQYYPNTINTPQFPPCVFGGDKDYESTTVYRFE